MTSGLPDWMRGARTQRYGGWGPNETAGGPARDGVGQSDPDLYGAGHGSSQNPYAVGGPGQRTKTGDAPASPDPAPSGWSGTSGSGQPASRQPDHGRSGHDTALHHAAAHYVPGSPAPIGSGGSRRPGLVALAMLLVLGSFAYLVWHAATWGVPLLATLQLENCATPDARMSCVATDEVRRWVYAPLLAVVLAWGFASGAATEGRQGRARGYLHLLAGIAVLIVAGLVSSL